MTRNPKDINDVLDTFAHEIAIAAKAEKALEQKVDAFKALTAYAALRHKMRQRGDGADEDGETTMDELRGVIDAAGGKRNGRAHA